MSRCEKNRNCTRITLFQYDYSVVPFKTSFGLGIDLLEQFKKVKVKIFNLLHKYF